MVTASDKISKRHILDPGDLDRDVISIDLYGGARGSAEDEEEGEGGSPEARWCNSTGMSGLLLQGSANEPEVTNELQ